MRGVAKRSLSGVDEMDFRILGPLEVIGDGRPLSIGGVSQRALLALLLLHANEVVSSDRLMDELWTGEPPASGVTALQVRISQLRKALGAEAERIETKPPGYRLRIRPEELDLARFSRLLEQADHADPASAAEQLREALALWRGPPLADLAYESFAQAAIGRIEELRLAALERRIDADLALGRHAELVGELEELVTRHPLRERLHGQLMLALYRCRRQAEALEVYQSTRRALVDALGIAPSPSLQELEQAILRQDPELELVSAPVLERSILVAAQGWEVLDTLLSLAEPLARHPPKELILARLVGAVGELVPAAGSVLERRAALLARGVATRAAAFVSPAPADGLVRFAVEQDVDLMLVHGSAELLRDPLLARLLATAPCDVAVVVGTEPRPGPVLVPFVGADHDWAAVELAAWAARALGAPLIVAGPRESAGGQDASRLLANASLAIQRTLGVAAEPLLLEPGAAAVVAAAVDAGLVVVGLTERWQTEGLGKVRGALATAGGPPVVLVKRGLRPGGLAPREGRTRFTWSIRP
jgi:DNA-binding SARP family transcriptional activator